MNGRTAEALRVAQEAAAEYAVLDKFASIIRLRTGVMGEKVLFINRSMKILATLTYNRKREWWLTNTATGEKADASPKATGGGMTQAELISGILYGWIYDK